MQPEGVHQLQGGGLLISLEINDQDTNPSQTINNLKITLSNVTFVNNEAAEGGGLYTTWPMDITDCHFKANSASRAVSACCLAIHSCLHNTGAHNTVPPGVGSKGI
jgi:predicted outer membrane repeat protein